MDVVWDCADCAYVGPSPHHEGDANHLMHMTASPAWPSKGDPRFHALLKEIGDLHDQKQADYGTGTDPFANVRGSEEWGVAPWLGAMVRANDKVRRLQTYAKTGTLANEGVEDSLMDLAVYALIALILFREGNDGDT